MASAHLLMMTSIDTGEVGFAIFSERHPTVALGHVVYAEVLSAEADTYGEARQLVLRDLRHSCRAWYEYVVSKSERL